MFAQNTLQAAKRFVLAWIERAMGAVHPYETTLSAFVLAGVCVFVASKNNASLRACLRQLFPLLDIPRLLKYRVAWFMNSDLDTIAIQQEFQRHWSSGDKTSGLLLAWSLIKTIGAFDLLIALIANCLTIAANYSQLSLIKQFIEALDENYTPSQKSYSLVGAVILSYATFAVARGILQRTLARSSIIIHSCCVSAVFEKLMVLDLHILNSTTAQSVISVDIPSTQRLVWRLYECIDAILTILLGVVYLSRNVGETSYSLLVPIIGCAIASYIFSAYVKAAQDKWYQSTTKRVTSISNMLSKFKSMRMAGLSNTLCNLVNRQFANEIELLKGLYYYLSVLFAINLAGLAIVPAVLSFSMGLWTRQNGLAQADTYILLTISTIITYPVSQFVHFWSKTRVPFTSAYRVQTFLLQKGLVDIRKCPTHVTLNIVSSQTSSGKKDQSLGSSTVAQTFAASMMRVGTCPVTDGKQVLQDAEAYFPREKLTIITGAVGCGKSTLLRLLLGEIPTVEGKVFIDATEIGYVGQKIWLQNESVKRNIIGPNIMLKGWYQTVIEACCLTSDFSLWPNGDNTLAGHLGDSLSQGQRQRIALARALYSQKRILLLDDIFSGLDRQTSNDIFEALFSENGLLRKSKTTVLLVSNLAEHVPFADSLLELSKAGEIIQRSQKVHLGFLRRLATGPGNGANHQTAARTVRQPIQLSMRQDDGIDSFEANGESSKIHDNVTASRAIPTYMYYMMSFGKRAIFIWLILIALGELIFKVPNILLHIGAESTAQNTSLLIWYTLLAMFGLIFSSSTIWWFITHLVATSYETIHTQLLDVAVRAASQYIFKTDMHDLINRFSNDMALINGTLPQILLNQTMWGFSIVFEIGIIAANTVYGVRIILCYLLVTAILFRAYANMSNEVRSRQAKTITPVHAMISETCAGMEHIRAFSWQKLFVAEFNTKLSAAEACFYDLLLLQNQFILVLDVSILMLAAITASFAFTTHYPPNPNGVAFAFVSLLTLRDQILRFVRLKIETETHHASVERILDFINTTPTEAEPATPIANLDPLWPSSGKIEFHKMSLRFNPEDRESPRILTGVTFTARPGQRVGLVGRTGSGKSSLIMSILKMMQYEGSIKLDGIELRAVSNELIRSRITAIDQDFIILPGSIRFNLYPYMESILPAVDDELLIRMLEKVGLWWYINCRGGLDADVSSIGLSQGQQQMLNIARGMVHHKHTNSKLVLMDEITSQLDYQTDRDLQRGLYDVFQRATMIVVGHRVGSLKNMDFVVNILDGTTTVTPQLRRRTSWSFGDVRSQSPRSITVEDEFDHNADLYNEMESRGRSPTKPEFPRRLPLFNGPLAHSGSSVRSSSTETVRPIKRRGDDTSSRGYPDLVEARDKPVVRTLIDDSLSLEEVVSRMPVTLPRLFPRQPNTAVMPTTDGSTELLTPTVYDPEAEEERTAGDALPFDENGQFIG